jgi:Domain of unknown function (DUF1963)
VNEGDELVAAVRADPILAEYAEALEAYGRPSIRLRPERDAPRYLGESKVGGRPSVPTDFRWPTRHVEMPAPSPEWIATQYFEPRLLPPDGISAYQFIAQIDLEAVAPHDPQGLLPRDGLLLFFHDEFYQADVDPQTWKPTSWSLRDGAPEYYMREFGFDQVDQVRVIHVPGGEPLRLSDDGPHVLYAIQLVASSDRTLPNVDTYVIAASTAPADEREGRIVLPGEAWTRLSELEYELRANANIDQMLGWADNGAHGPSLPPDFPGWAALAQADRLRESQDARLLLQLSPATYEPTGIRFGRTLYFYIRDSDLRQGDFSSCWYDSD